eukprot:SAG31_NODE_156_length_22055_cov_105.227728_9_plen_68_part_00
MSDGFHNLTEADMTSRYAVSIYTIFKLGDGLATQPQEQWSESTVAVSSYASCNQSVTNRQLIDMALR